MVSLLVKSGCKQLTGKRSVDGRSFVPSPVEEAGITSLKFFHILPVIPQTLRYTINNMNLLVLCCYGIILLNCSGLTLAQRGEDESSTTEDEEIQGK